MLLVVVFVVILVEKRRAFDKDYDKDCDKDSTSQIPSRCTLPKRLSLSSRDDIPLPHFSSGQGAAIEANFIDEALEVPAIAMASLPDVEAGVCSLHFALLFPTATLLTVEVEHHAPALLAVGCYEMMPLAGSDRGGEGIVLLLPPGVGPDKEARVRAGGRHVQAVNAARDQGARSLPFCFEPELQGDGVLALEVGRGPNLRVVVLAVEREGRADAARGPACA